MKRIVYLGNILSIAMTLKTISNGVLVGCIYEDEEDVEEMLRFEKNEKIRVVRVRSAKELDVALQEMAPIDLGVVANFGIILTESNLGRAGKGFINVHPGLLPDNKGRHPVQRVFKDKLAETGVTLHRMTLDVDAGPVLAQAKLSTAGYSDPDQLLLALYLHARPLIAQTLPVLL